jgi:small-conductance mechanosensitive channel
VAWRRASRKKSGQAGFYSASVKYHERMTELFSLLMVVFPFIFVGALARELSKQTNDGWYGWRFFLGAGSALGINLLYGVIWSAVAMADRRYTASAIAMAMVVLRSIPIVLVCWGVQGRLARRRKERDVKPSPTVLDGASTTTRSSDMP